MVWAANFEDDVRSGPKVRCAVDDFCAGTPVVVVIEVGVLARSCLDDDFEAELDQFFDDFGYGCNPLFAGKDLSRYSDSQWHSVLHHMIHIY